MMQSNDEETTRQNRAKIADILAKAAVRWFFRAAGESSGDNSPKVAEVGLSSSPNDCSL